MGGHIKKIPCASHGFCHQVSLNRPFRDCLVPQWIIRADFSVSMSGSGLFLYLGVTGYQMSQRAFGWLKTSVS